MRSLPPCSASGLVTSISSPNGPSTAWMASTATLPFSPGNKACTGAFTFFPTPAGSVTSRVVSKRKSVAPGAKHHRPSGDFLLAFGQVAELHLPARLAVGDAHLPAAGRLLAAFHHHGERVSRQPAGRIGGFNIQAGPGRQGQALFFAHRR